MTDLDLYQAEARQTAIYPASPSLQVEHGHGCSLYPFIKLGGEAGEVLDKIGKAMRDNNGKLSLAQVDALRDELGDVLWYVAMCADELGISLGAVARRNIEKLQARQAQGKLQGSGDNR